MSHKKSANKMNQAQAKKSAGNNQWTNTSQAKQTSDERRDGPSGENLK